MDRHPISFVRTAILVGGLALVTLTGCGGSEEDDARDAVKDYAAAIADGDEKKVCASLSEASKKQFDRANTKCERAYRNFGAFLNAKQKERLKDLDPDVKIDGASATTQVDEQPLQGRVKLKKEAGEWKISTP